MNIRTKLILSVGVLAGMIILLVALSVVNLQILTATEPDSPAAVPGLQRALLWISVIGGVCIFASIILLVWLPRSISKPIQELTRGILEIANHNYEKRLDICIAYFHISHLFIYLRDMKQKAFQYLA